MKLNLLLSILCLCITSYISAQSWVNDSNRWHIQLNCVGGFNGFEVHAFFLKDSLLLDGKKYMQLYETVDSTLQNAISTRYWYREENSKIYILEPDNNRPERLIYDFSLMENDTLTLNSGFHEVRIKVVSSDSVTLENGSKRKRLTIREDNLDPYDHRRANWIEGIGSDLAPLDPSKMFISDCQENMNCFYVKDSLHYRWGFQSCTLFGEPVSVRKIQELSDLKIFPNPFTTELYLEATLPEDFKVKDDYTVAIFDAQGKQLYHNEVIWVNKLRINTSTWHRGLYFLVIRSANGVLSRKLIKI